MLVDFITVPSFYSQRPLLQGYFCSGMEVDRCHTTLCELDDIEIGSSMLLQRYTLLNLPTEPPSP